MLCAKLLPHTKETNVEGLFAPPTEVRMGFHAKKHPNVALYVLLKCLTAIFFALRAKVEVKIYL